MKIKVFPGLRFPKDGILRYSGSTTSDHEAEIIRLALGSIRSEQQKVFNHRGDKFISQMASYNPVQPSVIGYICDLGKHSN